MHLGPEGLIRLPCGSAHIRVCAHAGTHVCPGTGRQWDLLTEFRHLPAPAATQSGRLPPATPRLLPSTWADGRLWQLQDVEGGRVHRKLLCPRRPPGHAPSSVSTGLDSDWPRCACLWTETQSHADKQPSGCSVRGQNSPEDFGGNVISQHHTKSAPKSSLETIRVHSDRTGTGDGDPPPGRGWGSRRQSEAPAKGPPVQAETARN